MAARHHGPCELLTARGRLGGVPAGKLGDDELPAVGDWVAVRALDGERKAVIEAVLPRRTAFTRKEAWRRAVEQVVAANVDTMFLTTAFGADLNPRRIERYLTATWDSGADPVLVVNKLDEARRRAGGARARSRRSRSACPCSRSAPRPARASRRSSPTSAAGARSRCRRVVGRRQDDAGRTACSAARGSPPRRRAPAAAAATRRPAATCSRCPTGGLLLDTPGMRELQLWADEEALDSTFPEVAALAGACRFGDCAHEASRAARSSAALARRRCPAERYDAWRKLQRELRALEVRRDARLRVGAQARGQGDDRNQRRYYRDH